MAPYIIFICDNRTKIAQWIVIFKNSLFLFVTLNNSRYLKMRGLLTLAFAVLAAAKAIPYVGNDADVSNHDIVKNENKYDTVIRRHDKVCWVLKI